MSMYGLTASLIPLLRNAAFGVRIKTPTAYNPETGEPTDFEWKDTAVQELADMLLDALANTDPIPLATAVKLDASRIQGPPIIIIGEGGETIGFTGTIQILIDVSVGVGTLDVDITDCVATITGAPSVTKTYLTLTFENGLLLSTS